MQNLATKAVDSAFDGPRRALFAALALFGWALCAAADPVVQVGQAQFDTIAEAIAETTSGTRAVLLQDVDESVEIPEGATLYLDEGDCVFRGTFSGAGNVNMAAAPKKYAYDGDANGPTLFSDDWTGTFQIAWNPGNRRFVFGDFGVAGSKVACLGGDGGTFSPVPSTRWKSGGSVPTVLPALSVPAGVVWTVKREWNTEPGTVFASLSGAGTLLVPGMAGPLAENVGDIHYRFEQVEGFTGVLGGGARRRCDFSFGDIAFGEPDFDVCIIRLDENANVSGLDQTTLNGEPVPLVAGTVGEQRGVYLARAGMPETGEFFLTVDEALASAIAQDLGVVAVYDGTSEPKAGWIYEPGFYTRYAAMIDGTGFMTLPEAVAAAQPGDVIVLRRPATDDVVIAEGVTLDCGIYAYTGTFTGAGTIRLSYKPSKQQGTCPTMGDGWTGRFVADWEGGYNYRFDVNAYGNANSVVEVTRLVGGYIGEEESDAYEDPFTSVPMIDVSGSMTLNNNFFHYDNASGLTVRNTVLSAVTGSGRLTIEDNIMCAIGTFDHFTGTFATTNVYEETDLGAFIGNIVTDDEVVPHVCFLKTTPTTVVANLDTLTVNSVSADYILAPTAAQPGVYIAAAEVVNKNGTSGEESVVDRYAFLSDAAEGASGELLVSLLVDSEAYVMTVGERLHVRANGHSANVSAPQDAVLQVSDDDVFENAKLYVCVSTIPESLYSVTADGSAVTGSPFSDAAAAFEAAFAAEGALVKVKVESGDDPVLDGELATRVATWFVATPTTKTYTMYRDGNDGVFMIAASDASAIIDAGIENPASKPDGSSISYAQAAALGLLTIDGLNVEIAPFCVSEIDALVDGKTTLKVSGSPSDKYSVVYYLVAKGSLDADWPATDAAIATSQTGVVVVDATAPGEARFYLVVAKIANK